MQPASRRQLQLLLQIEQSSIVPVNVRISTHVNGIVKCSRVWHITAESAVIIVLLELLLLLIFAFIAALAFDVVASSVFAASTVLLTQQ